MPQEKYINADGTFDWLALGQAMRKHNIKGDYTVTTKNELYKNEFNNKCSDCFERLDCPHFQEGNYSCELWNTTGAPPSPKNKLGMCDLHPNTQIVHSTWGPMCPKCRNENAKKGGKL